MGLFSSKKSVTNTQVTENTSNNSAADNGGIALNLSEGASVTLTDQGTVDEAFGLAQTALGIVDGNTDDLIGAFTGTINDTLNATQNNVNNTLSALEGLATRDDRAGFETAGWMFVAVVAGFAAMAIWKK